MKKLSKRARISSTKAVLLAATIMVIGWILQANFQLVVNRSESLPIRSALILKGKLPSKVDQIFVFKVRNNKHYPNQEKEFIKLAGGFAGDQIEVKGGEIYKDEVLVPKDAKFDDLTYEEVFRNFNLFRLTNPEEFKSRKITIIDKEAYVAGKLIGVIKPYTKKFEDFATKKSSKFEGGERILLPIEPGIIPPHKFFAYTPHKDSLDSRYQDLGLVDEKDIIGTAIATF